MKERYRDAVILICADIKKRNAYAIARQCEENGIADYLFYESIRTMGFQSGEEALAFLREPLNRMTLKSEIYMKKTMELQQQVDYFREYADIRNMKPAKGKLRERQLELIRVSSEFLEKMKELEIKPFLCSGNLLGYVRHNGFIPWDDDIDFAVIRSEYEKLKEYCMRHMYTENEFYEKGGVHKEITDGLEKFYWSHNGGDEFCIYASASDGSKIVIDFFPMDFYAEDYSFVELMKFAEKVREKLSDAMFDNAERIKCFQNALKENSRNVVKESSHLYYGIDNMGIMQNYHRGEWIPKEVLFPLRKVFYEGAYFWVPNDAEEYVKYEYENIWDFPEDVGMQLHLIHE